MQKDELFRSEREAIGDFVFGKDVADVFDDMLNRSVPFYLEMQRMIVEMARDFSVDGTNIYDLGCSTGTTLNNLNSVLGDKVRYIGVDSSKEMLEKCSNNLKSAGFNGDLELVCADLNNGLQMENASFITMVLTFQFLRPLYRDRMIKDIFSGLNENGCFILIEKVLGEDSFMNRQFIKYYYDLKRRNGYSDLEISQKREALENILIPYKIDENKALLLDNGFRYCDVFFKWYNFCGLVAVK